MSNEAVAHTQAGWRPEELPRAKTMEVTEKKHSGRDALTIFNIAAALMTVIPLLICCYLIAAKFYSIWILVGLNGVWFLVAIMISVIGMLIGRRVITIIARQLAQSNAHAQQLLGELKLANQRLEEELVLRQHAEKEANKMADVAADAAESEKKRAVELDTAYQDLRSTQAMLIHAERIGAVGQLAGGVAHEVKNPLAIILQGVNYMEKDATPRDAQQAEVLTMIKEAVLRADKIIRALLDFSRQDPLKLKAENANDIIEGALDLVGKEVGQHNVTIKKEYDSELPLTKMSAEQIKQVFINIILNALKAMPNGGELTIRTRKKTLADLNEGVGRRATDFFKAGDTVVECEVSDTGTGIPGDILDKVFDPFFTTRPVGKGTGLGLTVTRSIIDAHRGLIAIDTQVGRGTTMKITLPAADRV